MAKTVKDVLKNPWVRAVGLLLLIILLGWLLYYVRGVLTPFILAFIFAYVFNPVVNFLQRHRIPRELAIAMLIVVVLGILAGGIYLLQRDIREAVERVVIAEQQPADIQQQQDYPHAAPASEDRHTALASGDARLPGTEAEQDADNQDADNNDDPVDAEEDQEQDDTSRSETEEWVSRRVEGLVQRLPERYRPITRELAVTIYEALLPRLEAILEWLAENIAAIARISAAAIVNFFIQLGVFVVAVIYLMRDIDSLLARIKELLPSRYKDDIMRIIGKIDIDLRNFISGQILVVLILVVMFSIALWLAGIPYAFPIALISGFGNLVPYLGFILGIFIGGIATIAVHGFDMYIVYFILIYIAIQSIESGILTPNIVGGRVKFSPVLVLFSVMVFARLLGLLGIVFAVPIAAIIRVITAEVYAYLTRHKNIEVVIPPPKEPPHSGA